MWIYFLILFFITISGIAVETFFSDRKNSQTFYLLFWGILLTLFASFRYAIGYDYFSYQRIFYKVCNLSFMEILRTYPTEFLFYFLNKLVFLLGGNYTIFLLFITTFIHVVTLWFIRK